MQIVFLFFVTLVYAQSSPYACDVQLFSFYRTLGLPSTAVPIPPIEISPLPGGNGVDLVIGFESIARLYQSSILGLINAPQPTIEYVSFSYPWCTTSIQMICGGELRQNLPKTWQCDIPDYDLGGISTHGGRLLITRNASCENMRVRLLGPLALAPVGPLTAIYTYSTAGLPPKTAVNFTSSVAIRDYQNSWCAVTLGENENQLPIEQRQLVCYNRDIQCLGAPRPSDINSSRPFTPFPTFACRFDDRGNEPPLIVWHVNGYDLSLGAQTITYELRFCPRFDESCNNIPYDIFTLTSGTREQFISNYTSFESVLVLKIGSNVRHYDAAYLRSLEPFIRDVPCVCGLSLICSSRGVPLTRKDSLRNLTISNILPVAIAGPNVSILLNTPSVLLNASDSFDKDRAPNLLSYRWKVYNTTPTAVSIECVDCAVTRVNGPFERGYYAFVLYVSDGEDVTFDVVGIFVDENVIRVVLPPDFDAQFDLVTRCPSSYDAQGYPVLGENFTAIVLNGSLTYNENPNFPLFYEWTQTTGNEINTTLPIVCDPATVDFLNFEAFWRRNESIAYFIPSTLGIYCFRLTVTDGTGQRTAYEEMCVSVEDDFSRSNATDRNYTDYPDAPGYNHSDPVVPNITFEPANRTPINDITQSPSATLPPPPPPPTPISPIIAFITLFFPQLPPPTLIAQLLLLFVTIACLLVFILLTGYCIAYMPVDDFDDFIEQQVLQQQQQ